MPRLTLSDHQYERIAPLLPGKATDPGRTAADNRLFVEAVLWIVRTRQPMARSTSRFRALEQCWSRVQVWHTVSAELAGDADFEEVFIDNSTIVRAHQYAAGAPKKRR